MFLCKILSVIKFKTINSFFRDFAIAYGAASSTKFLFHDIFFFRIVMLIIPFRTFRSMRLFCKIISLCNDIVAIPAQTLYFFQFFALRSWPAVTGPVRVVRHFTYFFSFIMIRLQYLRVGFTAMNTRMLLLPFYPLLPALPCHGI